MFVARLGPGASPPATVVIVPGLVAPAEEAPVEIIASALATTRTATTTRFVRRQRPSSRGQEARNATACSSSILVRQQQNTRYRVQHEHRCPSVANRDQLDGLKVHDTTG